MHLASTTVQPGVIEVGEVDPPAPAPDEAVLRVEAVGICGTDLHIFDGSYPVTFPLVQGHEIAGVVESLPDGHTALAVGDRVAVEPATSCGTCHACRHGAPNACARMSAVGVHRPGGLQGLVSVPVAYCHPTGGLAPEVVALCEPMSVSLHAVTRAGIAAGERVVVLGCGPIGLGAVIAAVDRGAEVLAVDLQPARLALAGELGATATVRGLDELPERVREWTSGDGATAVVEATGVPAVVEAAVEVVATAGRIAMVGVSEARASLPIREFTRKELTVVGSRATRDFPAAVALVARRAALVSRLVTHEFPLVDTLEAVRFAAASQDRTIKTLVRVAG
jgi:L-gulonate 5-dehydrogenase